MDGIETFLADYRVVQALQMSMSETLQVRLENVAISSRLLGAARRLETSGGRSSLRGTELVDTRRLQQSAPVIVRYEIHRAPDHLTPETVVNSAETFKADLNTLLENSGIEAHVAAVNMELPSVEYRLEQVSTSSTPTTTLLEITSSASRRSLAALVMSLGIVLLSGCPFLLQ